LTWDCFTNYAVDGGLAGVIFVLVPVRGTADNLGSDGHASAALNLCQENRECHE
jgi:hypothetical protein